MRYTVYSKNRLASRTFRSRNAQTLNAAKGRTKMLPSHKLGGCVRLDPAGVARWLREHSTEAA